MPLKFEISNAKNTPFPPIAASIDVVGKLCLQQRSDRPFPVALLRESLLLRLIPSEIFLMSLVGSPRAQLLLLL